MHRLIMDAPDGTDVDHRNMDRVDNRRSNLRLATRAENLRNQGLSRNNTSGFKGVSRLDGKWRAEIRVKWKLIYLGLFDDKVEAARAYDTAAKEHFGEFARLNFPEALMSIMETNG